ncbi:MAG TPA: TrmH family RNA methyltransferase, partial [Geminicoccaceae bacterium]|nr:TrmH family RNA methyltransferase [Geminicoccaceae bacterium]
LLGRESAGVPEQVREEADLSVRVPMVPGLRSLNVVQAAAVVMGEVLRQTGSLDRLEALSAVGASP